MFSYKSARFQRHIQQIICFLTSLIFCLACNTISLAKSINAPELVNKGAISYQAGEYQQALDYWQKALAVVAEDQDKAIVEENLARAYQQLGQNEEAIALWLQVATYYRSQKQEQKSGQILTEQAQLYNNLGQPRKALGLLCGNKNNDDKSVCLPGSSLQIARNHKDSKGELAAIGSLGNTYRILGDYDRSIACLENTISTKELKETPTECQIKNRDNSLLTLYRPAALQSLGSAYTSRAQRFSAYGKSANSREARKLAKSFEKKANFDNQKATDLFKENLSLIDAPQQQLQTLINLGELENSPQKDKYWQQARDLLKNIPDSRNKAYAAIKLANLATPYASDGCLNSPQTESLLSNALAIAQNIQDNRAQSFALGELGRFYECRQEYDRALEYTQQAEWQADRNLQNQDSLYLWEWQEGRILSLLGQNDTAIPAYQRAIATLKSLREDILSQERELQLDFRDNIEPIYREFAELNLELALKEKLDLSLNTALQTVDELRIAELENYFGNDCILATTDTQKIKELLGKDTAVLSSIILNNRTAIILSLPNGTNKLSWIETPQATLRQDIVDFKEGLLNLNLIFYGDNPNQKPLATKLYNSIIAPFQTELESAEIKTLVFVQDGLLRNIPMAALYDGSNYLIQKYAIATTPSLTLTKIRNSPTQDSDIIAFGLSEPATIDGEYFPSLAQVKPELDSIAERFPKSKILLDRDFTQQNFQQAIAQAINPIVHIASHGKFGTIPQDSFLVLGNNQKMTMTELEEQLEALNKSGSSVSILALSACETAVGDDRATLGLAGTAVRAGVESTLASLWAIPDESTQVFIDLFYGFLQQGKSKAEALKLAQLELLNAENNSEINSDYSHPFFWSAFISIGNWL